MKRLTDILADLVSEPEPLTDDAREAVREGLSRAPRSPESDEDEPGLPLGWEGVEVVL